MLRRADILRGYTPLATDGEIGSIKDFYFDDERWIVRYLVVDTGGWLSGRRVLVSPYAIEGVGSRERRLALTLPRDIIRNSPDIDTARPISRQHEADYYGYYGWAPYWGGMGLWGAYPYPQPLKAAPRTMGNPDNQPGATNTEEDDPHLRSVSEVTGYIIMALDGEIGHVGDFIIDDYDWSIRALVVDTGNWFLPGSELQLATDRIAAVRWTERRMLVDLPKEVIAALPTVDTQDDRASTMRPGLLS